jgi:hypothetical protein
MEWSALRSIERGMAPLVASSELYDGPAVVAYAPTPCGLGPATVAALAASDSKVVWLYLLPIATHMLSLSGFGHFARLSMELVSHSSSDPILKVHG